MLIALFSASLLIGHVADAQTGPGGVGANDGSGSLKLWYRADNGVTVTGTAVDSWTNSAGIAVLDVAGTGANRPTLVAGAVNGYPEISFSGSNNLVTAIGAITTTNFVTNQASTFVVSRADNTTQTSCVYTTDPLQNAPNTRFSNHIPWAGTVYYDIGTCCADRIQVGGLTNLTSYSVWSYDAINTAVGKQLYRNGTLVDNVGVAASTYNSHATQRFNIGSHASGASGFAGDITEVIIFRQKINTTQRRIIQNYLAAKYGLALTADDLYTMDNSGNGNFDHDVAGIGRVSATDLHDDSRGTGIVRVLNPGGLGDGDYFFWGHDNGALTTQTTDVPSIMQSRYTRIWRGQEVGDITDLDIEFDLTGLGSVDANRLRLLIDTDNDGQFSDETPISWASSQGGNIYRFSNVTGLTAAASSTLRFTLGTIESPGGVSGNLVWWLKADAGVLNNASTPAADGDGVSLWVDQRETPNNAANATAGTRPIFRTNVINEYPALEFNGTKFLDAMGAMGIGGTDDFIIFLVFKQNSFQTNGLTTDGEGTFIIDRSAVTDNLASFKVVNTDKYFYQRRQDDGSNLGGPVSATPVNTQDFVLIDYFRYLNGGTSTEGIYIDGSLDITTSGPTGSILAPPLRIGRHATNVNGGLNGYFTEIVAYNTELGDQARQRVESYLALKYGITLDPSVDYLRSGGSSIYPSSGTHSGYVHDIAGIGQDNNSGLYQPTSRSQNTGNMITVSNPSDLQDNEFLVWGHNNGDLTQPNTTNVGPGIELRLSRVWRVRKTGTDLGTVSITVDLSAVAGPKTAADLRLLVDSDGDFVNATPFSVGSSSGEVFTFNNVTIGNDNYFTIGTVDVINTPLPVELTQFDVTHEPPIVVATWETASELNNDYFTLERAGEDLNFFEISSQQGAGTSSTPR